MLKAILLSSALFISLNAEITLSEIDSKPASRAKNFLIWQYLKQDINSTQADYAYKQILGEHSKLNRLYLKKSSNEKLEYKIACQKKLNLLKIVNQECFNYAMKPYKTFRLTNKERIEISSRLTSKWKLNLLKIQSEIPKESNYIKYDKDTVLRMFLNVNKKFRRENLNIFLSKKFINELSKSSKMTPFIKLIFRDKKLNKLQHSLLQVDGKYLDFYGNFLLALYNLKSSNKQEAMKHLILSNMKSKKRINRDKSRFWMYLITHKNEHLQKLLLSMDINIYTLYAHEKLNKPVVNFFTTTDIMDEQNNIDIQDPFEWNNILKIIRQTPKEKLFELAKSYKKANMPAVNTFILEKAYAFKMHGYILPYEKYLKDVSVNDKALIYSIMRQESNYIPAALSRSFALGLMQLMPFLVDSLSKQKGENIEYKDMFNPQKNIEYSIKHLTWMKRKLSHPLFLAYAYNGGTGFLRKHFKTGAFNPGDYEPFLSMELMANSQSREYGKKVLANYVMYKKILGEEISILTLFDNAIRQKKTLPH